MTVDPLWLAMIRAEHRAQVHRAVADQSSREALKAREVWLQYYAERFERLERSTPSFGRWPIPMSDEHNSSE